MYMIPKREVDGMNYPYDELKEDLREDFDYWVVKRGCSVDGMYYYAMEEYDSPAGIGSCAKVSSIVNE